MNPVGTSAEDAATAGEAKSVGGTKHSKSALNLMEDGGEEGGPLAGTQEGAKATSRIGMRNSIAVIASSPVHPHSLGPTPQPQQDRTLPSVALVTVGADLGGGVVWMG